MAMPYKMWVIGYCGRQLVFWIKSSLFAVIELIGSPTPLYEGWSIGNENQCIGPNFVTIYISVKVYFLRTRMGLLQPVTIDDFDIWNFVFVLSAMHDKVGFNAVFSDAANHFYLTVYDVINYNDVTSATNPFVFVESVLLLMYRL